MDRASGILMHISSLPSPYGIGTMGKAAYEYADFLKSAGQKYWQLLPLGPTGFGDSPYQSFCSAAGNPYFIDLDMLIDEGILTRIEVESLDWGDKATAIDYGILYENRYKVLRTAKVKGWPLYEEQIDEFVNTNNWVKDYARFMALKEANGGLAWTDWTITDFDETMYEDFDLHVFIQYLFYKQWYQLRKYVNNLGIKLIGDIPIYVPLDSVEVWLEPEQFQLDENLKPLAVSGVPPDQFSDEGQLWGTPLYDYDHMKSDGYSWWIRRIGALKEMFDVIRIDHFRGFDAYYSIPYGDKNAINGEWIQAPGIDIVRTITQWFYDVDFIAEDLGVQTPSLRALLEESGLPGMKILQYAFIPEKDSSCRPYNIRSNCICYTGTHDNPTLRMWKEDGDKEEILLAKEYLGISDENFSDGIIRCGMGTAANLFIAPMQDWLNLGREGLMNVPQVCGHGNWTWRMKKNATTDELAERILRMTKLYGRIKLTEITEI